MYENMLRCFFCLSEKGYIVIHQKHAVYIKVTG